MYEVVLTRTELFPFFQKSIRKILTSLVLTSDFSPSFPDHLGQLADRLIGPFDIEAVVDPIGVKISDAIMNFQNSGYEVTSKVFEDCGRPRLQKRQVIMYCILYLCGCILARNYSSHLIM